MPGGTEDVRIGLVGMGSIGWRHAEMLVRMPGVVVVAVADVDDARLAAARDRWGVVTYPLWEDLLEREQIDALFVCTPPFAHAAPAIAALVSNIAVFVEKPVARHLEHATAVVEAQRTSGAVGAVGYQWRAVDFLETVRAGLADQRVGLLAGRSIGPSLPRPWFLDSVKSGGVLLELASHDIDLQRALAGEVVSVQAAGTDAVTANGAAPGFTSVAAITLRFRSGALGAIQVAWLAPGLPTSWALDIVADRASYHISLDPHFSLTGMADGTAIQRKMVKPPTEANIARFIAAVRSVDPSAVYCTLDEGARTLAVSLACEAALATGMTVNLGEAVT
jgi:myo-inositol 2-dehydrogenase/D-chiro-inositol 1-dehydrogenase